MVVLRCPEIQSACAAIVEDMLLESIYERSGIKFAPIDLLYVCRVSLALGNAYMAHKCGFTYSVLHSLFLEAGFKINYGGRNPDVFELFIVSFKQEKTEAEAESLGRPFLPL